MSDKSIGVYFNDKSTIFISPQFKVVYCVHRKEKQKKIYEFPQGVYHEKFKKKFMLYHYITNLILGLDEKFEMKETKELKEINQDFLANNKVCYVTNSFKSSKCLFFKTNGKLLQACFYDGAILKFDYKNGLLIFQKICGTLSYHSI